MSNFSTESAMTQGQRHLCKSALHTGVHLPTNTAMQHWFWQNSNPTAQCCCATQADTGLYQGRYTYANLLCIQVFVDPPPLQCSTCFAKLHSPLLRPAQQPRLRAGLHQCRYTCANLLCIQVCTYPPPLHCSTGFGKMRSHCSVLLCNTR